MRFKQYYVPKKLIFSFSGQKKRKKSFYFHHKFVLPGFPQSILRRKLFPLQ